MQTIEANEALYQQLRAGDQAAREQMIVRNVPLAYWLTDAYLRNWPRYKYLEEDLLAAAIEGLVDGVNGLGVSNVTRPTGYLATAIRRQLAWTARKEARQDAVPTKFARLAWRAEFSKTRHGRNSLSENVDIKIRNMVTHTVYCSYDWGGSKLRDVTETLTAACKTNLDRQLIDLRSAGYTLREIGDLLQLHWSTLGKWLKRIKKRFDARTATN